MPRNEALAALLVMGSRKSPHRESWKRFGFGVGAPTIKGDSSARIPIPGFYRPECRGRSSSSSITRTFLRTGLRERIRPYYEAGADGREQNRALCLGNGTKSLASSRT